MNDLVSVIVPVYNRAAQLRRAVASAIAQTYRPIEIVIVAARYMLSQGLGSNGRRRWMWLQVVRGVA